jgi:dihydroneopterin aldolase
MDKILMNNLGFYGFHGVMEEEKTLGQKFFVDLEMRLDLSEAGKSDRVEQTVSYAEVYDDVKYFVESARYNLIEALAENICNMLLAKYPELMEVMVRVKKPEAPIRGIFDYVGVEIRRVRINE